MPTKVDMCEFYDVIPINDFHNYKLTCEKGHKASIKCHSERTDCPDYKPSIALSLEEVKHKYGLSQ